MHSHCWTYQGVEGKTFLGKIYWGGAVNFLWIFRGDKCFFQKIEQLDLENSLLCLNNVYFCSILPKIWLSIHYIALNRTTILL